MKMQIRALLFLIALFSAAVLAQKSTPETRISTPSDTTKTKPPAEVKPEPKAPKIELPDVLILGKDQYHRTSSAKKELTPESPQLFRRDETYEPLSSWFSSEDAKPQLNAGDSLALRQIWGKLRGGSYYSFYGNAGYWQKLDKGDALGSLWFDRSEGQFSNSKYAQGGLAGTLSYQAAPNAVAIVHGEYSRYLRGLQERAFSAGNAVRSIGTGQFAADLQYDINALSDGNVGIEISGLSMNSDTAGTNIDLTDNFYYDVHFDYATQIKKAQLTTRGRYMRETLESKQDSASLSSSFAALGVEWLQLFSRVITAAVGADWHLFNQDTLFSQQRISPFARLNLTPGDQVGLSLQLSSGLKYTTLLQYWDQNGYLTHRVPLRPAEERIGLLFTGDIKVTDKITFRGGYARSWMKEMFFWQADTSNGLLALNSAADVDLVEIQIGVTAKVSEKTHVQISYIDYSDEISDNESALSPLNRLPYRADFRMPIRASIQLLPQLNLMLTADIFGARKRNIRSDKTLPAYGLIHANLSARVSENVSALLSVRNLLDAKYVVWEGYPEMGIIVTAGLSARF